MLARIGLAASSQAHAPPLSDPRLAGAITASLGALLLADGLWITSLGGGWRIVAWAAGGLGAVAVMIGATGYMLSGWMAMSAAAAACVVTGMFAVMPLLVPGIRAQRNACFFCSVPVLCLRHGSWELSPGPWRPPLLQRGASPNSAGLLASMCLPGRSSKA